MNDRNAGFRIGPDIIDLGQGADLGLEFACDQLFDIGRFHAREEGRDYDFTDNDRGVFLTRKCEELAQAKNEDRGDENHRQSRCIQ